MLLVIAWQSKSFGALLLSGAIFFFLVSLKLKSFANALLPIIFLILSLSVVEFSLPSFYRVSQTFKDPNSGYAGKNYYQQVPELGYRPSPGTYTSRKFTINGEEIYNVIYTIGPDGYRKSSSPDKNSIYLYGGSYVFGEGLNDNETLVYFLMKNHNLKVKSVGIHGYGLHQALFNISNGISSKNGTNVLLTAPWHALRSSCKPSYSAGTPRYQIIDGQARLIGVCAGNTFFHKVLRHSHVYNLIRDIAINPGEILDEDIALYLDIIKSIALETKRNNSKLVVGFIKATDEQLLKTQWTNQTILKEISLIASEVIDVTLSIKREYLDSKYYIHSLDQHPSAKANIERAKLIFKALKNNINQ